MPGTVLSILVLQALMEPCKVGIGNLSHFTEEETEARRG